MRHLMIFIYASTIAGAVTAVIRRARRPKERTEPASESAPGDSRFGIGRRRAKFRHRNSIVQQEPSQIPA